MMRTLTVATACAVAGVSFNAAAEVVEIEVKPGEAISKQLEVKAGKFAELCASLKTNQTVNWQFRADTAVDFNVHFHVGERVEYPERRVSVTQADGHLVARAAQMYCWMWTNPSNRGAAIEIRILSSKALSGRID